MPATLRALPRGILGLCAAIVLRASLHAAGRVKVYVNDLDRQQIVRGKKQVAADPDNTFPGTWSMLNPSEPGVGPVIVATRYRLAPLLTGLLFGVSSMSTAAAIPGIVQLPSHHSVAETVDRLEAILKQRGILVFARIDFSGDAGRAGLSMRPEQMLIFGNPKAGTPLMLAVPAVGLDLPMKVLVWEDAKGSVWAAYKDPKYLVQRYGIAADLTGNLAAVVPIIERAAAE